MKFMKNKGYEETTLRKVRNDDKTILYGVLKIKIFGCSYL